MSALAARRRPVLAVCGLLLAGLLAAAAFAPLPYSVAQPGVTADVLGEYRGEPVISVSGEAVPEEPGERDGALLMTTIAATGPDTPVRLGELLSGWFGEDRAVLPKDVVYPEGDSPEEIREHNEDTMLRSQDAAVDAALDELGIAEDDVVVTLSLEDIGGPSAGLLFALGIVDTLDGEESLTGGATVAGTGTIDGDGTVGPVGGVPLKTQAARRDGATAFLVPLAECADAAAEVPEGLRLIPVRTLDDALAALAALRSGEPTPAC
ncbi:MULTISPECIES: S16 family serine protease [unclassified Streptomyces]|uniref:S16 family serine protease n=1 Tax=unclassified Streptomyces TaxID=2593676 RepID=UPI0022B7221C|nr:MULTISPECIES: S16 family serine protease [unclassified Streptomyces]MCZ7414496.1 hypothetical protein [Streptomyces sp. WMMC897]MCZ7431452.1 hypothetical protein [Streptomyces sp. WMMC1477]